MSCFFPALMHLCTTTFHPVRSFLPPAQISAAVHSQIGVKENGGQTFTLCRPSRSTDKPPFYHHLQLIFTSCGTDHHGRFLVTTNVSGSTCWNQRARWSSSPDLIGTEGRTLHPIQEWNFPFISSIDLFIYSLFIYLISSLHHFLKVEHLLASCLIAFAVTFWAIRIGWRQLLHALKSRHSYFKGVNGLRVQCTCDLVGTNDGY